MPWCPTASTVSGLTCTTTSGLIFQITLTKILGTLTDEINGNVQVSTGSSSSFYPNYENNDPFAAISRGYYFDGVSSTMNFLSNANNNNQMVISPVSAIGL